MMLAGTQEWDDFEAAAARVTVEISRTLPRTLRHLAFASPLCARTPDAEHIWHRGLRARDPARVLAAQRSTRRRQLLRAPARAGLAPRRFAWRLFGEPDENLLVCSSIAGGLNSSGGWVTPYIPTEPHDAVLAFGYADQLGDQATLVDHLSPSRKLAIASVLLDRGRAAIVAQGLEGDEAAMLWTVWHQWARGMLWLHDHYLHGVLNGFLAGRDVAAVGCVHEMHSYSRVVWGAASDHKARTVAVQHAGVAWGKRWYFPHADELEAGLTVPDVMFVFSSHAERLLRVGLPSTRFDYGCSARFARWCDSRQVSGTGRGVLFVGAMAGFDNEVLLKALRRISATKGDDPPRLSATVRLHPHAMIGRRERSWLSRAERAGRLRVSHDVPLVDDIESAEVVVGVGTTVLEEALFLGRPVVQLCDPDYVDYVDLCGLAGVRRVEVTSVGTTDLMEASAGTPRQAEVADRLGLDKPLVDYARLFADVAATPQPAGEIHVNQEGNA